MDTPKASAAEHFKKMRIGEVRAKNYIGIKFESALFDLSWYIEFVG